MYQLCGALIVFSWRCRRVGHLPQDCTVKTVSSTVGECKFFCMLCMICTFLLKPPTILFKRYLQYRVDLCLFYGKIY